MGRALNCHFRRDSTSGQPPIVVPPSVAVSVHASDHLTKPSRVLNVTSLFMLPVTSSSRTMPLFWQARAMCW
ncbi:hypothetical protein M3J09_006401 [Ascochyta lentis]